jgi:hypothetical protein
MLNWVKWGVLGGSAQTEGGDKSTHFEQRMFYLRYVLFRTVTELWMFEVQEVEMSYSTTVTNVYKSANC